MDSESQSSEPKQNIEKAVGDLLDEIGDEVPPSELKLRLRIVGGKVVESAVHHKETIVFVAGAAGLTAAGFLAARHLYRKRKK